MCLGIETAVALCACALESAACTASNLLLRARSHSAETAAAPTLCF